MKKKQIYIKKKKHFFKRLVLSALFCLNNHIKLIFNSIFKPEKSKFE